MCLLDFDDIRLLIVFGGSVILIATKKKNILYNEIYITSKDLLIF